MVTESRASFTRLFVDRHVLEAGVDEIKAFGIGGYDPFNNYPLNGGLPAIAATNYTSVGGGGYTPSLEYSSVWDFVQNVAISKGTHAFKMGVEFRSVKFPFFQLPNNLGNITYSPFTTAFPSSATSTLGPTIGASTGDAIASALLGQAYTSAISTANIISTTKVAYAGYFQDDWKFSPKLTLNLGMRYELWSPIGDQWGRQANFDLQTNSLTIPQGANCNAALPPNFATQFPTVTVNRCNASDYLIRWDKVDFGPRIGIAYHFANKMVLRLGYGIFYGGEENLGASPIRGEGVPFNETVTLAAAQGTSSYIGISEPQCVGCDFIPNGLASGIPANPFALSAAIKLLGVQTDFDNPLVHKWNVILQRELPANMALEVGYEGNHQAHQVILADTDTFTNLGTTNSAISSGTLQEIQPACPPPTCVSVGNGLLETISNGYGNYAAGSAKLEKKFSHGLQFISAYTWSHVLANAITPLSGTGINLGSSNGALFPNDANWASGYSNAAWDIRQNFTTGFNYNLPVGRDQQIGAHMPKGLDYIIGGWQANGILTLHTGLHYSLAGASCQGVWGRCEPDIVPGHTANEAPPGGRTDQEYFNVNAYTNAAPLTGGDLGIQTLTGPPVKTLDFSMFKNIKINERFKAQIRAEAFNLSNFAVLNIPDANYADAKAVGGNGNFGKITSSVTGSERHIQFALKLFF